MTAKQPGHTILVVDNEPMVVDELVEFLSEQGYSCVGCVDPAEAPDLFKKNASIDIVLSDFRMPRMTGVQLVNALSAIAGSDRVFEAIIFTGNAEKNDVIDALRAGVADYYQKPLDLVQLLDGLTRVIAKIEKRSAESKIKVLSANLSILSSSLREICHDIGFGPSSVVADSRAHYESRPRVSMAAALSEKLSRRQRDVAMLIAKGFTNYQIACELGISENTVKIYVSQILRIFNLTNRTQLAIALETGPLSDRDRHDSNT